MLELQPRVEGLRAERNQASEAIGEAKRSGQDAEAAIATQREVGARLKELEQQIRALGGAAPGRADLAAQPARPGRGR